MFNFGPMEKSINDYQTQQQALRADIEALEQQLDDMKTLPLPRNDLVNQVCKMLDCQAQLYPERLELTLRGVINSPLFDFETSQLDLVSSAGATCQPGTLPRTNALWFFGELIKERITDAIMEMPYPDKVGLPLSKRRAAIEKLDREIKKLKGEESALQKRAVAVGVRQVDPIPTGKREQQVALTEKVKKLVELTPFPDHAIRGMLANGIDPMKEMEKIRKPSLDGLDSVRSQKA